MKKLLALVILAALAAVLLYVMAGMPPMGDPDNPTRTHIAPSYLENAKKDTGSENVVTAINVNYRGFDAMGKVAIIFTAMTGVIAILGRRKERLYPHAARLEAGSSIVVRTMVRFLVPFVILFSLYIMLNGEVTPGGGFQGGAIIGASMIIFTTIFGYWESSRRVPQRLRIPLEGSAIIVFLLVGVVGLAGGGNFLTYAWPAVSASIQPALVTWLTVLVEIAIGIGYAMALISILYTMIREEEIEVAP
jgi:multicomponent Na+:H+ antiporter subunit B